MFCSSCGVALSQKLKYCNRCGAKLVSTKNDSLVESTEKRLHDEGVDLFWVTVIGLGLILGGMIAMKALQLSNVLIVAYMILGSTAFIINIALSLWQIRRLVRISEAARDDEINHLPEEAGRIERRPAPEALPSVTEHTTRTLEPVSGEHNQ
ncbi:MAG TPA: hypothetical protein VFH31_02400 [Pyrinomonadaceae bacterium]|nr:hypothetical protein [Pyrinomonadaceae bacterium]